LILTHLATVADDFEASLFSLPSLFHRHQKTTLFWVLKVQRHSRWPRHPGGFFRYTTRCC